MAAKNIELEREVAARLAAEAQALRRMQHLTTLHAIDLVITSNLDLRLTMRLLLEQIVPQLGADAGAVLLLNPYTQILEYGAGWGFNTEVIERSELRLGEGAAGIAAQERRMVILSPINVAGAPFLRRELVGDENFVSYCAVPLIGKGLVKGVLELFLRRDFAPEEEWKEFFDALAVQAAVRALPDDQRLAVALVLIDGLSYAEAAAVLGVPAGTLTSRLVRGRQTLLQTLAEQGVTA